MNDNGDSLLWTAFVIALGIVSVLIYKWQFEAVMASGLPEWLKFWILT